MRAEVLDSRIGVEYTSLSHPRLDLYAYRYYGVLEDPIRYQFAL